MKASEIEGLLPAVFQRAVRPAETQSAVQPSKPLRALLGVMETLHEPAEEVIASKFPTFFDLHPDNAPDEWLPFLATWVDLAWLLEWVNDEMGQPWLETWSKHLRALVDHAPYLSRWRGTARGLERFLELATGVRGFKVYEGVTTTTLKFSLSDTGQESAKIAAGTRVTVERTDAAGEGPLFVTAHDATLTARRDSVDVVAHLCDWVEGEPVCDPSLAESVPAKALTVLKDPIAGVKVTNTKPAWIRPFHIVVRTPDIAVEYRALVEKIVEMEKPAYVTYDIKWVSSP